MDINQTATFIKDLLLADSSIELDEDEYEGLIYALSLEGHLPTCDECEELVMGNDEGDVEEISARFPEIAAFIDSFF